MGSRTVRIQKLCFSAISLILVLAVLSISAFAWFSSLVSVAPTVGGQVLTGYFESGSGSADDPYILSQPIHVYNLAWLQYMGEFNKLGENGKIVQTYFKLKNTIDMKDMVLPPIGTTEYPFVGNFDGNGKMIHNFTVTNYLGSGDGVVEGITERPLSVVTLNGDDGQNKASIVGFFGVVGDYNGALAGLLADDTDVTVENKVIRVYDLKLDDFVIRTESDESLIGLLAGYVNGMVDQVGIGMSQLEVGQDVAPMTDEEVFYVQQAISLYTLIGAYDTTNVDWSELPEGSGGLGGTGSEDPEGTGFGASINMLDLAKRVTYMIAANESGKDYSINYNSSSKTFSFQTNQNSANLAADPTDGTYTLIPLKISNSIDSAIYNATSSESVHENNTGYIVGDPGGILITTKPFATALPNGGSSNNLTVYEVASDGVTSQQITDGSKYVRYNDVIQATQKAIVDNNNICCGIDVRTMVMSDSLLQGVAVIDKTAKYTKSTVGSVTLAGSSTPYTNYDLINGGITFHIQESESGNLEPMYITAVSGTYASSYANANTIYKPFSLYIVGALDSDNHIVSSRNGTSLPDTGALTLIEDVWERLASGDVTYDVKYNCGDTSPGDGYVKKYDADLTYSNHGAVYYQEIPVKPGEYVLSGYYYSTMTGSSTRAPTLLYLDIGANGNIDPDGGSGGDGDGTSESTYTIEGVNFVDDTYLADDVTIPSVKDADGNVTYGVINYHINVNNNTHETATATFDRQSATEIDHSFTPNDGSFTVTQYSNVPALTTASLQQRSPDILLAPVSLRREE